MVTDWAPPRSHPAPRPPAPPADLDSPAGELALLRALVAYRLVGPHKHVQMAALLNRLAKDPGMRTLSNRDVWAKWNQLYDADTLEQVWRDQQEQLLPGSPSPSPTPASTPSRAQSPAAGTAAADRASEFRSHASADGSEPPAGSSRLPRPSRLDAHYFPVREFSLTRHSTAAAFEVGRGDAAETEDHLSLAQLAFQRGQVPPGERAESPAEGPLRQVSVPPGHVLRGSNAASTGTDQEEEEGSAAAEGDEGEGQSVAADEEAMDRPPSTRKGKRGRPSSAAGPSTPAAVPAPSPKKKRRTAGPVENALPSPRKRARTATKGGDAAAEESELSELSDEDDDDDGEEEEEDGGEGGEGGDGEEGGEAEEGDEEDSDGDTVADDDDDDFAPQSKSKATKKKKGTAASSNRRPTAAAAVAATASDTAASRSASPGAAAATPAKTTRAGVAARAKKAEREKSESAATPRSSSRRSGAGGPANKRR